MPAIDGGRLTARERRHRGWRRRRRRARYTAQWFSLDNATGTRTPIGAASKTLLASADGEVSLPRAGSGRMRTTWA